MSEMKKICSSSGQSDKDRISVLPDAIQTHILSFLPIEDAFRTSLLSSQWRHACSTLSKLQFIKSIYESKKKDRISDFKFYDFVDRVLHAHNESSIDELWLMFDVDDEPVATHQIDEWISIAVSHHVQTFYFRDIRPGRLYTVPSTLITCTTLKTLALRSIKLNFPTDTVCFPTLTCLLLSHCRLLKEAVFSTSNCPVLEDFKVNRCNFYTLSISSSTLESLKITTPIRHPKINLSIPGLMHFEYRGENPPNISLETLSSLRFASFHIERTHHSRNQDLVGRMLKGLQNVRKLILAEFYVECIRMNGGRLLLDYPAALCCNLKVLHLAYSSKSQVPVLKLLLRNHPNLKCLHLWYHERARLPADDYNTEGYWQEMEEHALPDNIINSLARVTFRYFNRKEWEYDLIKFMVENAIELRKLEISGSPEEEIDEENRRTIREKLKLYSQRKRSPFEVEVIFRKFDGTIQQYE